MASWTYLLADLTSNKITAEVPLTGVTLTKRLNEAGTFNGTWTTSPNLPLDAYTLTTPGRNCVYAVRDSTIVWGGIIWTRRYDSGSAQVTIGAADWWSYFDHRKVVQLLDTTHGLSTVGSQIISYSGDQNTVARNLVTLAQTHTAGNIGIQVDAALSGTALTRSWFGYQVANVGDELRAITKLVTGPDIMFDTLPTPDVNGRPVRVMRTGTPHIGIQGSPHVWEFGGNMLSYTWSSDGTKMASRAFAVGNGINEGAPIAVSEDTTLYAKTWPLLEMETGYTQVDDTTQLQSAADSDQQLNTFPVVIAELVVNGRMAPTIGEFTPGDDCRMIVRDPFFAGGLDTRMRIVAVSVNASDPLEATTVTANSTLDDVA